MDSLLRGWLPLDSGLAQVEALARDARGLFGPGAVPQVALLECGSKGPGEGAGVVGVGVGGWGGGLGWGAVRFRNWWVAGSAGWLVGVGVRCWGSWPILQSPVSLHPQYGLSFKSWCERSFTLLVDQVCSLCSLCSLCSFTHVFGHWKALPIGSHASCL